MPETIVDIEAQILQEAKVATLAEHAFYKEKVGQMEHQIRLAEQADPPQTSKLALDAGERAIGRTQYEIHCEIRDQYKAEMVRLETESPDWFKPEVANATTS